MEVRLKSDWEDGTGRSYRAGQTVEVDPVTLARMEAAEVLRDDGTGGFASGPTPVLEGDVKMSGKPVTSPGWTINPGHQLSTETSEVAAPTNPPETEDPPNGGGGSSDSPGWTEPPEGSTGDVTSGAGGDRPVQ